MKTELMLLILIFVLNVSYGQNFKIIDKENLKAQVTPRIDPPGVTFPDDPALTKPMSAEISKALAYDDYRNGEKGIVIRLDINTKNLKGKKINVVSWFHFWNGNCNLNQKKLKDFNDRYRTANGQVSTSSKITPKYVNSSFSNIELFIPFSELHLARGSHDICFDFGMFYGDEQIYFPDFYMAGEVIIY